MAKQFHQGTVNVNGVETSTGDWFEDRSGQNWLGSIFDFFGLGDLYNSLSGAGLTSAEIAQNEFNSQEAAKAREFNAEQAQLQRDWQTEMDNTKVQRSVADMQAAGVNPAMMMGGAGVTASTPSGAAASGPAASGSGGARNGAAGLSALMDVVFAKQRYDMNKAQINLINSEANKNKTESDFIATQKEWYPALSDGTLRKIDNDIRVGSSAANLNDIKAAHENVLKSMSEIDLEYKDRMNDAELKFKSESTNAAKAAAARDYAAAAIDAYDAKYMKEHNTHVPSGSSELVALASWITENLGTNESSVVDAVVDTVKNGAPARGNGKTEEQRYSWLKDIPDSKLSDEYREKKHRLFGK